MGSSSTIAVRSVTAAGQRLAVPVGHVAHTAGQRRERRRPCDGWPVSASAPIVRPWKAPSAVTTSGRPVSRLILNAASLASAPELQKKTRPGRPARSSSRSASATPGSCIARLETCPSFCAWAVIASTTFGCAWPRIVVAMPPSRSVYSRPSTSQTVAPAPRSSATGGVR